MITPFRLARPLLAAALSLMASAAMAAASSSATMSVSYQLFDLNPLDGIAPSISFNADPNAVLMGESGGKAVANLGAYGTYTGFQFGPAVVNHGGATGSSPFANASAAVDNGYASASASVRESGTGLFDLSASGEARSANAAGDMVFYGAASTAPTADGQLDLSAATLFTLSAHTLVLFSADVDLLARTTVGGDTVRGGVEMASASFGLSVSGYSAASLSTQESRSNQSIEASYSYTGNLYDDTAVLFGQTRQFTQRVGVSFSNAAASELGGRFSALVSVAGNNAIPAVPEADALWLVLAGGATVLGLRRRQGLSGRA
jgi:hypothetical protein